MAVVCLGVPDGGIPDSSVPSAVEPSWAVAPLGAWEFEAGAADSSVGAASGGGRRPGDGPGADPPDERVQVDVLKAVVPLRISTWNSQALLGSMFSRAGRVTRKRRELERLLERSEVALIQEARGTAADLEFLPPTHRYVGSFGDYGADEASSLWGGVVIAVSTTLLGRSLGMRSVEVVRGRVLQVDLEFSCGWLRIVCVYVDPTLQMRGLRQLFSCIRDCCADRRCFTLVGGDFNLLSKEDSRYTAGGDQGVPGDGVRGEVADVAFADLLELHQPGWTHRRFREGRLYGASRSDRLYVAISSAALSLFVASAAVLGDVFDQAFPSDHLPFLAWLALARSRDRRIAPPIDRRVFEAPKFFDILSARCAVVACKSVDEAQDQLGAIKDCVRSLAAEFQFWPFVSGVATARDRARLAVRAWRAWMCRRSSEVVRCCSVWPELASHFEGGELVDQTAMRYWVSELAGAEAEEEEARVRRGPEPEAQKSQASEKIRRRAAKWRLRAPRVHLRGLLDVNDRPLFEGPAIGAAVSSVWGDVFGREHECVDEEAELWFLDAVPDLSASADWHVDRGVVRAAAARTGHSAPGPDVLPYALWRGADWIPDAVFEMLRAVGRDLGSGRPAEFGMNYTTLIPKGVPVAVDDKVCGRVDRTRTLTVGNTDARLFALSLNRPLAQALSCALSSDQRGFVPGRSILSSVALCEAAMAEATMTSVDAAGIFLDFANAFPTLSRRWLQLVLRKAKVPAQIIRAILFLYRDLESMFVFGGEVVAVVAMRCGVKQGCPLSVSLLPLCIDALLRRISCVPGRRRRVFAYADDLAIVVRRLFVEFPALVSLLSRWGAATGLMLRLSKSVVVLLGMGSVESARERLAEGAEEIADIRVDGKARYLGVYLVPDAAGDQWTTVVGRMFQRRNIYPYPCFGPQIGRFSALAA